MATSQDKPPAGRDGPADFGRRVWTRQPTPAPGLSPRRRLVYILAIVASTAWIGLMLGYRLG